MQQRWGEDGESSCGNRVVMGTMLWVRGRDGDELLSLCHSLLAIPLWVDAMSTKRWVAMLRGSRHWYDFCMTYDR